jgi:hypothetical protein
MVDESTTPQNKPQWAHRCPEKGEHGSNGARRVSVRIRVPPTRLRGSGEVYLWHATPLDAGGLYMSFILTNYSTHIPVITIYLLLLSPILALALELETGACILEQRANSARVLSKSQTCSSGKSKTSEKRVNWIPRIAPRRPRKTHRRSS